MLDPVHNNSPDRYLTDIRFTSALSRNNPCQKIYICSGGRRDRTYRYTEPFQRCIIGNSRLRKPCLLYTSCKPEDSAMWFDKLWQNTVDLFRSMDIPVRTIECCSGDLADLKVKSYDVEAWSPRQKKYFEVGSCSNLGDAQARRLKTVSYTHLDVYKRQL